MVAAAMAAAVMAAAYSHFSTLHIKPIKPPPLIILKKINKGSDSIYYQGGGFSFSMRPTRIEISGLTQS
jgi:hypothetical protein